MKLKKRVKLLVLVAFIGAVGILNFQNTSFTTEGSVQLSLEKAIACMKLPDEGTGCYWCNCNSNDVCELYGTYWCFGYLQRCD